MCAVWLKSDTYVQRNAPKAKLIFVHTCDQKVGESTVTLTATYRMPGDVLDV